MKDPARILWNRTHSSRLAEIEDIFETCASAYHAWQNASTEEEWARKEILDLSKTYITHSKVFKSISSRHDKGKGQHDGKARADSPTVVDDNSIMESTETLVNNAARVSLEEPPTPTTDGLADGKTHSTHSKYGMRLKVMQPPPFSLERSGPDPRM